MGTTTSSYWRSRQDVVEERIRPSLYINSLNRQIKHTCMAHSVRDSVLWTVWERVVIDLNTSDCFVDRFIGCDLIRCYGRGESREWGYKDMCESMGPYYWSCPLKYLDMAPVANEKWREGVRNWHAEKAKRRKFSPKADQIVGLRGCIFTSAKYVKVLSKGWHLVKSQDGKIWRTRTSQLTGEVFDKWPETV